MIERPLTLPVLGIAAGLALACLPSVSPAVGEERLLELFDRACLAERPDFLGTGEALAALGLTRGDAGPFFATPSQDVLALSSAGLDLPEGTGTSCTVMTLAEGAALRPDAAEAAIAARVAAPLTRHAAPALAAGSFEAREAHVWTWTEAAGMGKAILTVGVERGAALALEMAPEDGS